MQNGSIDEVSPRFDELTKEGTPFVGFKNMEQIAEHPLEENLHDRSATSFSTSAIDSGTSISMRILFSIVLFAPY